MVQVHLYGTYAMNETGEAVHLTASVALDESLDLPDLPLPSIPLELPTILPPGSIAHLLLDVARQAEMHL